MGEIPPGRSDGRRPDFPGRPAQVTDAKDRGSSEAVGAGAPSSPLDAALHAPCACAGAFVVSRG
ncbi:hypothetical protein FRAAL1067 [Frankia alni ACN14a]|uniref:Uncharacterized protein n=1 Tax=Frankia alni (strain DSM 45986 / CECT 9034 / ACN14a) TaxID=326424 RepID=Q0RRT4_FRAAA|nr:hypothetical protein FRAAL1067 [Frankia alni ACN14a]